MKYHQAVDRDLICVLATTRISLRKVSLWPKGPLLYGRGRRSESKPVSCLGSNANQSMRTMQGQPIFEKFPIREEKRLEPSPT